MASYQCRGKNKLWSVRFDIIENGLSITKRLSGFPRKKDAEQAYMNFIQEYNEKKLHFTTEKSILDRSFDEVFKEFILYKKDKVKESTYYDTIKLSEKHILPFFKNMQIKKIAKPKILEWQSSLSEYSYKYKSKIRTVLYSFYKYLFLYYDVDNIVARVEAFKKPNVKKEMLIWTLEEFNNFISTFEDDILYKTFFYFLYYTGCRLGEVRALNYQSLDLEHKTININKSLTTKIFDEKFLITSPKNYTSYRKIILPDILVEQLETYISTYPEVKESNFFFGTDKPLDDHTIYRRLEKHTLLSKNEPIRIHDFRHSHASLLIQQGANIVLVAKRLGHKDTEQTLNTYAHLYPNSEEELVKKLNSLK